MTTALIKTDSGYEIRVIQQTSGIVGPRLRKGDPTPYPPHQATDLEGAIELLGHWSIWLDAQNKRLSKTRRKRR